MRRMGPCNDDTPSSAEFQSIIPGSAGKSVTDGEMMHAPCRSGASLRTEVGFDDAGAKTGLSPQGREKVKRKDEMRC